MKEAAIKLGYKWRPKREHNQRGRARIKDKQYYRHHRRKMMRQQKIYRRKVKPLLKLRKKRQPHYHRIGKISEFIQKINTVF